MCIEGSHQALRLVIGEIEDILDESATEQPFQLTILQSRETV